MWSRLLDELPEEDSTSGSPQLTPKQQKAFDRLSLEEQAAIVREQNPYPLPTILSPETGQMEEVDPRWANARGIPIGMPRPGGGDPRTSGDLGMPINESQFRDFGGPTLLASTAKGIPIPAPSQEESDRLIRTEQLDKLPVTQDRINVPELDLGPHNTQVLDAPPIDTNRDIPIFDPSEAKLVDEKDVPLSERINPAETRVTPISPQVMDLVKGYEGWDTGQWDSKQYSTGYGTRAKYPGEKIDKPEAERRLEEELTQSANSVDSALGKSGMKLDPNQRDALISFDYNTGRGADLINTSKNPDEIQNRMLQYVHADGRVLPALVERRQDEARLFSGGAPSIGPDQAPSAPETTSAFGRMAGIPRAPEEFAPRQHAYDSAEASKENALKALEGFQGSLQGSSAALAKYVYKPVFGGIQNAIHALAPDSELSKYTAGLYDQFNKFAVEETGKAAAEKLTPKAGESTIGQISRGIGQVVGDIAQIIPTAAAGTGLRAATAAPVPQALETAAPTVFNVIKQQLPNLGKSAESLAIPALRSGMQAQDMAARMGASPADQNLAFSKAALLTMGTAALPLGVESKAVNMFTRFVERAAKAAPLGVATTAAVQGAENILSPGEARPFDPKQLAINSIPIVLLAGALGHNVRERPRGPLAEQAFPRGGKPEPAAPMPGGEVRLAPKEAPTKEAPAKPAFQPGDLRMAIRVKGEVFDGAHHYEAIKKALGKYSREEVAKAESGSLDDQGKFVPYSHLVGIKEDIVADAEKEIQVGKALSGIPPKAEPVPTGEERFAPGVPREQPPPIPAEPEGAGTGPPQVPPAPPGVPTIPPLIPQPRVPRIIPMVGTLKKFPFIEFDLNRTMQGTAEIFEKSGLPALGQAIRNHYDRFRFYSGMTSTPIRQWAKGISNAELKTAHDEFKNYWQSVDERWQAQASQALYNVASPKGQELIDIWKQLADQTGNIAVRKGLEVYNHDTGEWRPFHKIGTGFFPRRINAQWLEYMSKPDQYPAEMADLRREILAKGYVRQLSEVDGYLARALREHTPDDLSPLEHARTSPLPTRIYDYSFDTALNYLRNWSYDMGRIEAYGQKKFGGDEFTKAEGQVHDQYSKEYIKQVQGIAYRKVNKGAWVKGINLGTNVSTLNMLGNYVSSMYNAIGGILYNAVYNGVPPAVKALVNIKKTAGAIDNAYELGILQDNMHWLQQDVHNMTPAAKGVEFALKTSGYQLVEEWTRAMNLLAARDFLRKAIAENQRNPVSGKTVQYLARISRVGGIDPQALLREGGQGPLTDRYLRQNVAMIQGGYGFDQTPAWIGTPSGRMIMQFSKWGTQAADTFVKNISNPALQAISGGRVGKKEFVEVPAPGGGYRTVQVPGALLPVARFLVLSTAAGLAQTQLRSWMIGVQDKEASFAEILSRIDQRDYKAFGDLIHKVWMANMTVGAAGIIGNYTQMFTDITQRTRFKDPTSPPILAMPRAIGQLIVDGVSQGKLTARDFDQAAATINSGYRTLRGTAAQLNDAFGGNILPLKALSNRQDVSWLRSVTQRYDNVLNVQQPVFAPGSVGKNPLTPFTADLKEALLMGDQGRAADLLGEHLDSLTPSQQKVEMERIKQSVRGSHPIRVGGGTGQAMQSNFLEWSEENLPIKEQLRIVDIAERYEDAAVALKLMKPNEATARDRSKALKRIEDKVAVREGQ